MRDADASNPATKETQLHAHAATGSSPATRPLDPRHFIGSFQGQPRSVAHGGQATYAGHVLTALLPRSVVETVIPPAFALAGHAGGATDHPVLVMLGWQRDCSAVISGTAHRLPLQPDYRELIILVPYVVARGGGHPQWHNFVVRMFLTDVPPILIGTLFQYSKTAGDFNDTTVCGAPGTEVRHGSGSGAMVFACAIESQQAFGPPADATGFDDLVDLLKMPILGIQYPPTPPLPPQQCSYFEWETAASEVATINRAAVQFHAPLRPGMLGWHGFWMDADPSASFSVRSVRWRLESTPPACSF